ncbi:MAG: nuclear transport factor 2 family protein [Promethearchaeota archaeon]
MIEEIETVRKTVNTYLEAVKHKDWNKFQESWHSEARMSFVRDDEVNSVPRSFWEDWCKNPIDQEEKRTSTIASIDVTRNIASAKVMVLRETPTERTILTDYLTLLQDEGKWLIISKSYTSLTL